MSMFTNPLHQIFKFDFKNEFIIKKNAESLFKSPFNLDEREQMINLYKEKNNVNLFNGRSIRLDKIKNDLNKTIIELSMIEFYDFISTTMMYNQRDRFIEYCRENNKGEELKLLERLCHSVNSIQQEESFKSVIEKSTLSNILAVSILVEDRNGEVGLIKRSNNVAVSSGIFSTTCTGSLDEQDFIAENPFLSCAKRELEEELNIRTDTIDFKGLVMSKNKLQPIILLSVKLKDTWKELIGSIKSAKDFNKETQEFYSVPVSVLHNFLKNETFTDAAIYQILKKMNDNTIHVDDRSFNFFDKKNYLID